MPKVGHAIGSSVDSNPLGHRFESQRTMISVSCLGMISGQKSGGPPVTSKPEVRDAGRRLFASTATRCHHLRTRQSNLRSR